MEYISIGMRPFGETQSKAMRAYAQSEQYHTTMETRDSLHGIRVNAFNLAMSIESSSVNKKIVSLEGVVKSDSSVEQKSCEPQRCNQK